MTQEPIYKLNWRRPASVPFPSVWRRFERKDLKNPTVIRKFRVQDVTEDVKPSLIYQMKKDFLQDEPLCRTANFGKDINSVNEFSQMYYDIMEQQVAVVCLEEGPDGEVLQEDGVPILVGYNMLGIISKSDSKEPLKIEGKALENIIKIMAYSAKDVNTFEKYNVEAYMTALGLSVAHGYRGMAVGLEILLARDDICRAIGIKAATTVFSATASQILAARAGYEVLADMLYEEIENKEPDLAYPGIANKNIMYMGKSISR